MAEGNEVKAEDKASVQAEVSDTKVADEMPPTYDEASQLTAGEPNVKITTNETKIDIGNEKEKEAFQGLTKEELMKYANDPFWVRLRWILFIFFWIIWVAMLAASIIIIIYAPKCPSPEPKEWFALCIFQHCPQGHPAKSQFLPRRACVGACCHSC